MPITKSVKKRVRQGKKRRVSNKILLNKIKRSINDLESALINKDKKKSLDLLKICQKTIMKATNKGIIHKKTASRKISGLNKKIKALVI